MTSAERKRYSGYLLLFLIGVVICINGASKTDRYDEQILPYLAAAFVIFMPSPLVEIFLLIWWILSQPTVRPSWREPFAGASPQSGE